MATTKRQFMHMYQQAVTLLKQYKHQNDTLNKSIGLQHSTTLTIRLRSQQLLLEKLIKRLDQILAMLEQSYLDPQTARRIGTIKQQYKIQKDRRGHILKQIMQLAQQSQNNNDYGSKKYVMPKQTSQRQAQMGYQMVSTKNSSDRNNIAKNYRSDHMNNDREDSRYYDQKNRQHTRTTLNQQQLTEYDYQIQCKLLQQRNKTLQQTQKRMNNVYHITKQTKQMIDYQGQHLDIISDQIFKTRDNVKDALVEIKQANQLSKQRRRRIVTGVSIVLLLLAVVVVVVLMG